MEVGKENNDGDMDTCTVLELVASSGSLSTEGALVRPLNLKNTKPEKSEVKGESGRGHPGAKLGFVG